MDYQHVGRIVTVSDKMILPSNVHEITSFVYHTNALIRAFNVISSETRNFSSDTKIHNCVSVSINISLSGPLKLTPRNHIHTYGCSKKCCIIRFGKRHWCTVCRILQISQMFVCMCVCVGVGGERVIKYGDCSCNL